MATSVVVEFDVGGRTLLAKNLSEITPRWQTDLTTR